MKCRLSSIVLLVLLLMGLPASAEMMSDVVKDEEVGVQIEIPDGGVGMYTKVEIRKEDPKRYEGGKEFFISKVIDIGISDSNSKTDSLKPLRAVFFFDMIDFKRACQLNTSLSVGHFTIGLIDEKANTW